MAWFLARRGVRYLLVDSNPEVGAAWRSRWESLRLFSPAQYDGLPGSDFPAAADTYPGKDEVAGFASYAERNAFPILTGTAVTRVIRQAAGFAVHTTQGTIAARQVVVATGAFQQPCIPALSRSFAGVPQLHSAAYRCPADLPPGRVLVVGAANSGLQIAENLLASHAVTVAVGASPPSVPQRIASPHLLVADPARPHEQRTRFAARQAHARTRRTGHRHQPTRSGIRRR